MLDDFIDDNVYCYKMEPDGSKGELIKTLDPFVKDWNKYDTYRGKKRPPKEKEVVTNCTKKEQIEDMS